MKKLIPSPSLQEPLSLIASKLEHKEDKNNIIDLKKTSNLKAVFINTFYDEFLKDIYNKNPELLNLSYNEQKLALLSTLFGDSNFYSTSFKKQKWQAEDLIVNDENLQKKWCLQKKQPYHHLNTIVEQVKAKQPDVIYIQDMHYCNKDLLKAIRPFTKIIVGQIASPFNNLPLEYYDIIFSSFPHYVDYFRSLNITSYYMPLSFEPNILKKISSMPFEQRPYSSSFVGGITASHKNRYDFIVYLAERSEISLFGYGKENLPLSLQKKHFGALWGVNMFQTLANSKITINCHIDAAQNYGNNMRLFEATGCGALLITDYKDNLEDLFKVGEEIIAYRSKEECLAFIEYFTRYPKEAKKIATAGQKRTLQDHTYEKRGEKITEILKKHLNKSSYYTVGINADEISSDYKNTTKEKIRDNLTKGWLDPFIPYKQRALTEKELDNMYKGKPPLVFSVLATMIQHIIKPQMEVLEIGCSTGYYYEVIEYLTKTFINYTGVDYSEAMISLAKDIYPKAKFFCADGKNLPFKDSQFPVVISGCVLLHCPNYVDHIKETARVAEKYIVLHRTPITKKRDTLYSTKKAYGVDTVELRFNEQHLLEQFEKEGFFLDSFLEYISQPIEDIFETTYLLKREK